MNEGTIQTDVQEEQQFLSPREQALARIEERIDDDRQGQYFVEPVADTTHQDQGPVVVDDPNQFMVRVKVDGKDEQKPLSEVIASFQKNEAASERLRKASVKQRELEAWEQNILERERQIQMAGTLSVGSETDTDDGLDQALNSLVEGDTATAAQVIRDMVAKGRQQTTPPTIDEAAIAARVEEKLTTQGDWDKFLRDNPEFREDYDDQGAVILTKERQYGDFVFERDFAPRVERGEISYLEALHATASEVRKVFTPPPAAVTPEETARSRKLERKAAIDNLPVAAGARAAGAVVETDESPSDVIANMRKSRGLAK